MLDSLRVFQLVAATCSFTRAAREAALTRPAVSQHIKRLERHFGTQLLVRTTRRVELTQAGRLLLEHVERVLAELARMEEAMGEFNRLQATRLTVGASTLPGEYLLPGALSRLRAQFPEADVRVRVGDTDAVLGWIRAGEVELGLIGRQVDDPDLHVEPFAEDEIVLLLPSGDAVGSEIAPDQLAELPLVLREPGSATRATVLVALKPCGLELEQLKVVAQLGSPESVKAAVRAGMGAAFVSRLCLRPDEGPIARIRGVDLRRPVCACWRKDRPPGRLGQALVQLMRQSGAGTPAPNR